MGWGNIGRALAAVATGGLSEVGGSQSIGSAIQQDKAEGTYANIPGVQLVRAAREGTNFGDVGDAIENISDKLGGAGQPAPDPNNALDLIDAQTRSNQQTALYNAMLNRVNTSGPFGSTTWSHTPAATSQPAGQDGTWAAGTAQGAGASDPGQWSVKQEFSPELAGAWTQRLQNTTQGGQLMSQLGKEGVPSTDYMQGAKDLFGANALAVPDVPVASEKTRQDVINALMSQYSSRLDPLWKQQQSDLEAKLANQGITQGSGAWGSETDAFGRSRNDAYQTAMNNSIVQGGQEQERLNNMALANRKQVLDTVSQLPTLASQMQGMDLNNIQARMAIAQALQKELPNDPSGNIQVPMSNSGSTDVAGIQNQLTSQGLQQQQINNASYNAKLGLIGTLLGGGIAAMSDPRTKINVQPFRHDDSGRRWYTYSYRWSPETMEVGVMANEVLETDPQAVEMLPSGYMRVNYSKLH